LIATNISYSIAYACSRNKVLSVAPLQIVQIIVGIWWAHKDSNLGPAD
jgi:hypothetical protein